MVAPKKIRGHSENLYHASKILAISYRCSATKQLKEHTYSQRIYSKDKFVDIFLLINRFHKNTQTNEKVLTPQNPKPQHCLILRVEQ